MNWYLKVMKQYVDFNGRARRKEYWMFVLFNIIFFIVAMILDNLLGLGFENGGGPGILFVVYWLAVFLPSLAVQIRRLHDIGKSGWWILINFIPLIGVIWLLVLYCTDSTSGSNEYGPNPKEVGDTV